MAPMQLKYEERYHETRIENKTESDTKKYFVEVVFQYYTERKKKRRVEFFSFLF